MTSAPTQPLRMPGEAPLLPVRFSTEALAPAEQFEAWREQCSPLLDLEATRPPAEGYVAMHRVWKLGHMACSQVQAPEAAFHRTARHIRRDSLDHWVIGVARSGAQSFLLPGGTSRIAARQPHLFALHQPFSGRRTDVDWLTLFVARDTFPGLAAAIDAAVRRPFEGGMAELLAAYLDSLAGQLPRMTEADLPRTAEATRAIVAACLAPCGETLEAAREQVDRGHLAQVKSLIEANLRSPTLGPRRLCRLAGISRSRLYRLFEPLGGVAAHIQATRLREAYRALSQPDETRDIVRIAEACGFYDASTFSRAFRRAFGHSPSEIRQAAQAGQRGAPMSRALAQAARFTDVLRLL